MSTDGFEQADEPSATVQEYLRVSATQPLLAPSERRRAADASVALSALLERVEAADAAYKDPKVAAALDDGAAAFVQLRQSAQWSALAPDRRSALCVLVADLLRERYEVRGDTVDLHRSVEVAEEAVGAAQEAVRAAGTSDDARTALMELMEANSVPNTPSSRRSTAGLARAARDLYLPGLLPRSLQALGSTLVGVFERTAERAVMDRAVGLFDQAVVLHEQAGESAGASLLLMRGSALLLRFKRFGNPADGDGAVRCLHEAVSASGEDRARQLDGLACALLARAELPGHETDVDEAVKVAEQAVEANPVNPWFRDTLGCALKRRYQQRGRVADIRRAETLLDDALEQISPTAPDRLRVQHNLAAARSHSRLAGQTDPAAAVDAARALLQSTPPEARARPMRISALAAALRDQAEGQLDLRALDESVTTAQEGVATTPQGSPDRSSLLAGLAGALRIRYCLLGDTLDLEAALRAAEEAAKTAPADEKAACLHELARIRSLKEARFTDDEGGRLVSTTFSAASQAATHAPSTAVAVCRDWATWAAERGQWEEAADALALASAAMETLDQRQVGRADRERALAGGWGLAADAAVAAVRVGREEEALLAMERGRLRLVAGALDRTGAELEELAVSHRDLADAFASAAARLAAAERAMAAGATGAGEEYEAAEAALAEATDAVRRVPGYGLFRRPASLTEIVTVARDLPLAYVAAGDVGVVVTVGRGGAVRSVLVPEAGSTAMLSTLSQFLSAQVARDEDPERWARALDDTTRWLGDVLWSVVIDLLPEAGEGAEDAEVGIVPLGLMGLLPWSAAARPDPRAPGDRRFAIDDCAVRLVPSARLLGMSRARASARRSPVDADASALVVDVAEHVGSTPLRHAGREAAAVFAMFSQGRRLTGEEATREAILGALGAHDVVHVACHGRGDVFDPLRGALLVAGEEEVTAGHLLALPELRARLAVLSACQTATFGAQLPDEMIGLPIALLQAGVVGVMATLWEVNDLSTMLLVRRFFREWRDHPDRPALALARAQRWVRDADNAAKHAAFPDVPELAPPGDGRLRQRWGAARAHTLPQHWASFAYFGG